MKLTWNWKVAGLIVVLLFTPRPGRAAPINLVSQPFQTDYVRTSNTGPASCWEPGMVMVTNDSAACHPYWVTPPDALGKEFIAVNGSTEDLSANILEWNIEVRPDTEYTFSGWATNLCCRQREGSTTVIDWFFNSALMYQVPTNGPGVLGFWETSWFSGGATSLSLVMRNRSTMYDGNDFAVGGLEFSDLGATPTPEPTSMLLLGTGLALGYRKYRHSTRRV